MEQKPPSLQREFWNSPTGYIWSLVGSAVGFANILSFSAQCYKNGGGAFFIPFLFATFLVGFPMLLLEAIVGQKLNRGLVSAYRSVVGRKSAFWGWLSILSCCTIGGFYITLTGFSIAYSYFSIANRIGDDPAYFFNYTFWHDSGSLSSWGSCSLPILLSTLAVIAFTWWVMSRGIKKGIERVCSLFLPFLSIVIIISCIMALFLPGAWQGVLHYLWPDFSCLKRVELWRDVFGHVFFSLSLGLGIITGYSRHNKSDLPLKKAMLYVLLGDLFISFIAGAVIFSCVGYLSHVTSLPFSQIVRSDSLFEMGFIIFPTLFQQFPPLLAKIFAPLFFFLIFIAGITGVFSIIESIVGNIEEGFLMKKQKAVKITMLMMVALAFPYCMGNGKYILGSLVPLVAGDLMLLGGILQIVGFLYCSPVLKADSIWFTGEKRNWIYFALRYPILLGLSYILLLSLWNEWRAPRELPFYLRWSWCACMVLLAVFLTKKRQNREERSIQIDKN